MANMFINIYIYFMMFYLSIFMFVYLYKQILLSLLSLEFVMLSVLNLLSFSMMLNNSMSLILYYMVFVVCESVLGLTLLIMVIRSNGNDNMTFMNLILW